VFRQSSDRTSSTTFLQFLLKIADISLTVVKSPHISLFSRQVDTLKINSVKTHTGYTMLKNTKSSS